MRSPESPTGDRLRGRLQHLAVFTFAFAGLAALVWGQFASDYQQAAAQYTSAASQYQAKGNVVAAGCCRQWASYYSAVAQSLNSNYHGPTPVEPGCTPSDSTAPSSASGSGGATASSPGSRMAQQFQSVANLIQNILSDIDAQHRQEREARLAQLQQREDFLRQFQDASQAMAQIDQLRVEQQTLDDVQAEADDFDQSQLALLQPESSPVSELDSVMKSVTAADYDDDAAVEQALGSVDPSWQQAIDATNTGVDEDVDPQMLAAPTSLSDTANQSGAPDEEEVALTADPSLTSATGGAAATTNFDDPATNPAYDENSSFSFPDPSVLAGKAGELADSAIAGAKSVVNDELEGVPEELTSLGYDTVTKQLDFDERATPLALVYSGYSDAMSEAVHDAGYGQGFWSGMVVDRVSDRVVGAAVDQVEARFDRAYYNAASGHVVPSNLSPVEEQDQSAWDHASTVAWKTLGGGPWAVKKYVDKVIDRVGGFLGMAFDTFTIPSSTGGDE